MADVRISALPLPGTVVPASDVLPMVNGGNTTKVTPAAITTAALNATKVTVAQGGTGVGTLTGYVKGNGTANMSAVTTLPVTDLNFNVATTPPTIDGRTQMVVNVSGTTTVITLDVLKDFINRP